jgi:hypothetical protein
MLGKRPLELANAGKLYNLAMGNIFYMFFIVSGKIIHMISDYQLPGHPKIS